ncbi:kinase family protein [Tripterygium wilfordii]|uniref:Kinase family protein n=1 Tax=Tripterygium wilfordii TaxID=458696 RepID=A0A7J7C1L7_TRIWF|nr:probable receptor-like serine/threonine-protein kinase At5g57670 [Tripterygium wilfordii]KAF5727815.1 kinase family protein [Tripterygium wilfordii]
MVIFRAKMVAEGEADFVEHEKKHVLVGVRIDDQSQELISWALVKVAEPGDSVTAVHVCRSSVHALKHKPLLDSYLETYKGLCSLKKVELTGHVLTGRCTGKVLVREAKKNSAVALVLGMSKQSVLWCCKAKYCAKRLPPTTNVLAIHNGKIAFRRCNNNQLTGLEGDPKPSLISCEISSAKASLSEFDDSEVETEVSSFSFDTVENSVVERRNGSGDSNDEISNLVIEPKKVTLRSTSLFAEYILDQQPGWPLLLRVSSKCHARKLSVVHWAKSLPDRSPQQTPQRLPLQRISLESVGRGNVTESISFIPSPLIELQNDLESILKTNSSDCKWFSYEVLRAATCQFSLGNLIAKGGCNRVYKGVLPDGKPVAVKILKSSKEALKEFAHEVKIISSLKHKHIAPLLGLCIENNHLLSVYSFLSEGSLEEKLHGNKKDKSVLSWEVRFNVAVKMAEALSYLHIECSRPVIHRDVKSSNILLSDALEPQLSDFGLAIWGPTSSSFITQGDVVGTFGYLAPEYFMYGKVSDKIDVYAFGVVLLELLSGREPISSRTSKGQESLVMWAKPMLERGDVRGILDTNLDGKVDETQLQRMLLAATRCITRSARLRPKMNEILTLLSGEKDGENPENEDQQENQEDNDDEVYPNSSAELHLSLALLDVDDDSSFSSLEQSNNHSFEEYVKARCSRSSSFNIN